MFLSVLRLCFQNYFSFKLRRRRDELCSFQGTRKASGGRFEGKPPRGGAVSFCVSYADRSEAASQKLMLFCFPEPQAKEAREFSAKTQHLCGVAAVNSPENICNFL